jgi:hypothetical protein
MVIRDLRLSMSRLQDIVGAGNGKNAEVYKSATAAKMLFAASMAVFV